MPLNQEKRCTLHRREALAEKRCEGPFSDPTAETLRTALMSS